jgi:prepilin-type N-terminal cleavage/methylation domain-containing protein
MRRPIPTRAFTLIESMVAMVILGIAALVVPVALQTLAHTPSSNDNVLAVSAELVSEMEYWRDLAWGSSPWPTTLPYSSSDTVTLSIGGRSVTFSRSVSIQTWDPTNLAGNVSPQTDFARIQIIIGGQTLTAFTCRPT